VTNEDGELAEPVYLSLEDALEIYAAIIDATAAQAADHRSKEPSGGQQLTPTTSRLTWHYRLRC
jgi:hypothetical protein